jgi:tetratricopeptide (TPR) repeat protein
MHFRDILKRRGEGPSSSETPRRGKEGRRSGRRRLAAALAGAALLAAGLLAADWWFCRPEGLTAGYVGREHCVGCHAQQGSAWLGSDHQRAMAVATPKTVLGNFDNQQYRHFDVTSKFFRRGDHYYVTTDGPTGKSETFPVRYTFGVRPLQQYLVPFPDGRIQCLPLAWDTERKRWFHLYPNEPIPHTDVLHWTRPLQNWNYMCADCHSTDLKRNYQPATNRYHTTWSEISVSCEACHGPGSLHVELAESGRLFWDRRYGLGLPSLKRGDARTEVDSCAPCHARRNQAYPGFRPGQKFLDYYLPELLDGDLYYADGQIREEDYEYGSFLQSKMYDRQIRCTDCHDPHTARLRGVDPKTPWQHVADNRVCVECHLGQHPAGKYDTPAHDHHPDRSKPGALCVDCHMPETPYMVVDPRRDHSMRIPRPDLTVALGIPNACNRCHHDRAKGETPAWAERQVRRWYGERKEPPPFAYAFAAGRAGKPEGERLLEAVTRRKDLSPIVRASAIALLGRYGSDTAQYAACDGLGSDEPLVRLAAVRSLPSLADEEIERRLAPLLRDPIRTVRMEAARILSRVPPQRFGREDRAAFDAALAEYLRGQESLDDQPAAHLNIAVVRANLGDVKGAEEEYHTALRIDPRFVPARINLAMLDDQQGKMGEAEGELRRVIELEPKMAEAHYSLGLLLGEDDRHMAAAAQSLAQAVALAPENPRMRYNYGLALQKLGEAAKAEEQLRQAHKLAPEAADYLRALAIFYTQQKRWVSAAACAAELVERHPNDPQAQNLLEYARQKGERRQPSQ